MQRFVSCLLFILLVFIGPTYALQADNGLPSHLQPDNAQPSPRGVLDLSDPPFLRWDKVVREAIARHGFEHTFAPILGMINAVLPPLLPLAQWMENTLATRFPVYYWEMQGLVHTLHQLNFTEENSGVSTLAFSVWNFLDETKFINLTSGKSDNNEPLSSSFKESIRKLQGNARACSSIIARTKEGKILHGRNDDANAHHYTTNLTIDVAIINSRENNATVAEATIFLGWIGTYTVMRSNVASLTEDQRERFGPHAKLMTPAQYMAFMDSEPKAGPIAWVMRQGMVDHGGREPPRLQKGRHHQRSYASILKYLQYAPMGGQCYLILSGVQSPNQDQGAIITRNFTETDSAIIQNHTLILGQTTTWVPMDWALVETNYDFWRPLPFPQFDPRRIVIVNYFQKLGQTQGATIQGVLDGLSIPSNSTTANGVLNIGTIFTVMMIPSNNTFRSYLRNSKGCCG